MDGQVDCGYSRKLWYREQSKQIDIIVRRIRSESTV